jgi:formylglycine-generating enzyme required for sulfatase activity
MEEDLIYSNALVDSYFTVKFPDSCLMSVSYQQRIYCQNLVDQHSKLPHYLMSYCINPSCAAPAKNSGDTNFCITCGASLRLKDRYRAQKLLGQGGFGKTFKAVDEDRPGQPLCVIKQFAYSNSDPQIQQTALHLFYEEAKHLQSLGNHPQIPELLAYFDVDGQPYLVQQYIDGQDLEMELATEGAFNQQKIYELLESLLPVLDFLHNQSKPVIHRDIKPANIIRRRSDGALILVDFGVAKQATQTMLAKTGTRMIGSPEFAASEQIRGKPTFASDIYSLGVTCTHLLTNVSPFSLFDTGEDRWVWRDYLVNNSVDDLLGKVLDGSIENALTRRYQSATAMLAALNTKNKPVVKTTSKRMSKKSFDEQINEFFSLGIPTVESVFQPVSRTFQTSSKPQVNKLTTAPSLEPFSFRTAQLIVVKGFMGRTKEILVDQSVREAYKFIEDLGNGVKLEMVAIAGGEFLMGSPDTEKDSRSAEKPQHRVKVPSFYMGRYPVTQSQYEALVGNNPSNFKGKNLPVENVSLSDAQKFCQQLAALSQRNYCLPSESQWEYACRAGTNTPFYYGKTITTKAVNYNGNHTYDNGIVCKYQGKTSEVGSLGLANSFGLYDMHGNVWEWCEDNYGNSYQLKFRGGSTLGEVRKLGVLRGGCYANSPNLCRSAFRITTSYSVKPEYIGFRVVCSPARIL